MSQSSWQQQQHHLDSLQGMVNAVLIETGKALRSANANGVKTIGYTHGRIKAFLPTALDKFHLALDELESDIVRAQAVLSRDLRELRARQHEMENPKFPQTGDATLPGESNGTLENTESQALGAIISTSARNLEDKTVKDDIPDNLLAASSPEPKIEAPSDTSPSALGSAAQMQYMELPQEFEQEESTTAPVKDDISKSSNEIPRLEAATGLGIDMSVAEPSAISEAPATAGLQNDSYDSMFDLGTADDIFADFDFSTGHDAHDYNQRDEGLVLSSFGNENSSNKNDDVSTLLEGYEAYGDGKGAGDLNAPDLSNDDAINQVGADQSGVSIADDYGMSGGDLNMAMGIGDNGSTFNDLLVGMGLDYEDDAGEFDEPLYES